MHNVWGKESGEELPRRWLETSKDHFIGAVVNRSHAADRLRKLGLDVSVRAMPATAGFSSRVAGQVRHGKLEQSVQKSEV